MSILSGRGIANAFNQRWLAVAIFAIAICKLALLYMQLWAHFDAEDFSVYYSSGLLMRLGVDPYGFNIIPFAHQLGLNTRNSQATDPPTFLILVKSLASLPVRQAYWLWQAINLAALAASLYLLLSPRYSGLGKYYAITMAGIALLYLPVNNHITLGQSKLILLLLLAVMMRCMESGHDAAAGLSLALAGLLRVFPLLIMLYLLVQRRWRVLAYAAAGVAAGGLVTAAYLGIDYILNFVFALSFLTIKLWLVHPMNVSMNAFVSRMFWYAGIQNAVTIRGAVVLADLAVLYMAIRATKANEGDHDWSAFSLWVVAAVVLSPIAWFHDMVLLLLPFAQIASGAWRGTASARVIGLAIVSYFLAEIASATLNGPPGSAPVISQLQFASLMLLFAAVYWFNFDHAGAMDKGTIAA
jgi:hypothetical protein